MINLLPVQNKKEIRAGYQNVLLLRYTLLTTGVLVVIILAIGIVYLALQQAQNAAERAKQENQAQTVQYRDTQKEASQFRSDLTNAKALLDDETRYSQILIHLAEVLPKGTAISSLEMKSDSIFTSQPIPIHIKDRTAAENLEKSLKNSDYIDTFTLSDISTDQGNGNYPYQAEAVITFNRSIAK